MTIDDQINAALLPDGLRWFRVGSQVLYPIYGASGGVINEVVAILIDKPPMCGVDFGRQTNQVVEEHGGRWFTLSFCPYVQTEYGVHQKIGAAIKALIGD